MKEFKEAYKKVNKEKLGFNDSPDRKAIESGLAKLEAAQRAQNAVVGDDARTEIEKKLASLEQAQGQEAKVQAIKLASR